MFRKLGNVFVLCVIDVAFCGGIYYWGKVSPTVTPLVWPYMIVATILTLGMAFVNLHDLRN